MPLQLKGVVKDVITIDGYTFEVKGLSRREVYEFSRKARAISSQTNQNIDKKTSTTDNVNIDKAEEFEEWLINKAISDEKGRELVLSLPRAEFDEVFNFILNLSGLEVTKQAKNS